eukprot:6703183-Prymnesium_polylepis.1
MNSTRRSSPPGHLTVIGQTGRRGDAKYATWAASVTNGGASCASRGEFFLGKIVFFNTPPPGLLGDRLDLCDHELPF